MRTAERGRTRNGGYPMAKRPKVLVWRLVWAPEGREIARVRASTRKLAKSRAPMPYRTYRGEILAEVVEMIDPLKPYNHEIRMKCGCVYVNDQPNRPLVWCLKHAYPGLEPVPKLLKE